jgi:hypothetical protein
MKTHGDNPLATVRGSDNTLTSSVGSTEDLDGVTLDDRDGADLYIVHKQSFPTEFISLFRNLSFLSISSPIPSSPL